MHRGRRRTVVLAVSAAVLAGAAGLPGCGDSQQTGTVVEQTPEQKEAQKKSEEGMMKAMEAMKKGPGQSPPAPK